MRGITVPGDMTESMLAFVTTQLAGRKGQWPEIAEGSGVPYRTVQKIGSGKTESPKVQTVEKLAMYLRGAAAEAAL